MVIAGRSAAAGVDEGLCPNRDIRSEKYGSWVPRTPWETNKNRS